MSAPLVTCIMPTKDRRPFVGQAVEYFLRQDYPARELLVLDDGEDPIGDLLPADDRIRYLRLEPRASVGAKRNRACREARGDVIAHWDDDDWHAPNRLSAQVAQLAGAGADVCGMRELLHYDMRRAEAWFYRAAPAIQPWVAGCTLVYRRAAWESHPFPDVDVGEDAAFVRGFAADRVTAVADPALLVALIHRGNTAGKHLADPCWTQRSLDDVSRLFASDRNFYASLRAGPRPPAAHLSPLAPVTVAAHFSVATGYGSMAEYLVRGLAQAGARVRALPLSLDPAGLSDEFMRHVHSGAAPPSSPTIYFCWPQPSLDRFLGAPDLFINTMWESDRLPTAWVAPLNRARGLIVPSRFVADTCRASGVTTPIDVIAEGIDPDVYSYVERPEREGLTTLTIGPIDDRKHVAVGIEAWKHAFAGNRHARLIVKTGYGYHNYTPDDDRITYVDRVEHTRGLAHWYREADVLLALGNEGFGLPLVEAMATGLPVVALASEGQADVCDEAGALVLTVPPARRAPYQPSAFGACGSRGVPDASDVADRLTWVREHRAEARAIGREASAWAAAHRSVWRKGPAVLDVLERRVQPPRPLRRADTMWIPSWQQPCGVAEYTRDLTAALRVTVTAAAPDLRRVRLLHVQHHHGLFDEAELARRVALAAGARLPVVVTHHMVQATPNGWERDAAALVSPSPSGAALLARRWPGKIVQHIPHGCPPPRRATRHAGRPVIGAFGFLEPHKGMFALLDALRSLPECELLLFSHAKRPDIEAQWEAAAQGLPVRRVAAYLPPDEIARTLAERADILAFWYDEAPFRSASYAVRLALSTGVPVLTSPTVWFEDVREVTHQPAALADGLRELLDDATRRDALAAAAGQYCEEHSWARIAARHQALWRTLEAN